MATSRTRARDSDRETLCGVLDAAFAEGQLDGAEHRDRTAAALRARTLGELRDLIDDLQISKPVPELREPTPARPRGARWVGLVVSLVLLGAGFGIGRITAPEPAALATAGGSSSVDPRVVGLRGLHTPEGYAKFVSDVREQLGSTTVTEATIYPDYAVVTTPVPGAPTREQRWIYRGGLDGPDVSGTSANRDSRPVDLTVFGAETVLALVAGASESLKVPDVTSSYVILKDTGKGPQASVYASNEFHESGYLVARPDGSIVAVHPHESR